MSNTEPNPQEKICATTGLSDGVQRFDTTQGAVEILEPRAVPLGGPRAMTVSRALPQKARSFIGAWCFCDSFGPDHVDQSGGMQVPRHPHTGLATVSWLFEGEINHIDSAGNWANVRPGWVNLMNAGSGITHSEFSSADTTILHGLQLWYALPDEHRFSEPTLESFKPEEIQGAGFTAKVFLGSLLGYTSPVHTYIPLTGVEFRLEAGATVEFEVPPVHEHGIVQISGDIALDGIEIPAESIGFAPAGRKKLTLHAPNEPAIAVLLGGEPLGEEIIMWWNFIGRTHEEIALWRSRYMQEMGFEEIPENDGPGIDHPQFGEFPPGQPRPLPAPQLPVVRLRLRK